MSGLSSTDPTPGGLAPAGDLDPLDVIERRHVLKVLRACGNNKTLAARILRIGRKTLYRMLERWHADESVRAELDDESSKCPACLARGQGR